MIELVQFPWSPFCIVQRRILEFAGDPFKVVNIPSTDRSVVWRLTKQRYYSVPIVKDGGNVVFEIGDESQVVAKYLDAKLQLELFPSRLEGVQSLLWRHIESEIEGATFRLNDVYWREMVPAAEQLDFLRFKERKFGRGCLEQWRTAQKDWLKRLKERLMPYEEMVLHQPFLLGDRPRFVDYDLYGMLGNFLYSGHYQLPKPLGSLRRWHCRMSELEARS